MSLCRVSPRPEPATPTAWISSLSTRLYRKSGDATAAVLLGHGHAEEPVLAGPGEQVMGHGTVALPLLMVGRDLDVEPAAHAGPELLVLVVEEIALHRRSVSLSPPWLRTCSATS